MSQPPAIPAPRWRIRLVLVALAAVVLPGGAALLHYFPPAETPFYPRCILHELTGLHCPGCGATRCLGALVHGDLAQALAYNVLLVIGLPFVGAGLAAAAYALWTGRRIPVRLPPWAVHLVVWLILAFGVLRNVEVYPLTLLAPHGL